MTRSDAIESTLFWTLAVVDTVLAVHVVGLSIFMAKVIWRGL